MEIKLRPLDSLEIETLEKILDGTIVVTPQEIARTHWMTKEVTSAPEAYPTKAFIVWCDEDGTIQFGKVRWAHRQNIIRADGSRHDSWSATPFPGAWTDVPRDRIVRVMHPDAFL